MTNIDRGVKHLRVERRGRCGPADAAFACVPSVVTKASVGSDEAKESFAVFVERRPPAWSRRAWKDGQG